MHTLTRILPLISILAACDLTPVDDLVAAPVDPATVLPADFGCADVAAVQPNTTPADAATQRWIALSWACDLKASPRTAHWILDGVEVATADVDYIGGECFAAPGPDGGPWTGSKMWTVEIRVGGVPEVAVSSDDLPAPIDSALTWANEAGVWTPYLSGDPRCAF